jgi:hypothetical protein
MIKLSAEEKLKHELDSANSLVQAFSREVASNSITITRLHTLTKRLSEGIDQLVTILNSASNEMQNSSNRNFAQWINLIKTDHITYKLRVYMILLDSANVPIVLSEKECRLGQWYYNNIGKITSESFMELEEPHSQFHELVRQTIDANNDGNWSLVEKLLMDVEDVGKEVMDILTELQKY